MRPNRYDIFQGGAMAPSELKKPIVLAVDDKPANLLALEAALGTSHDILRANSGPEAISLLHDRRDIDVVLMDVHMPGMDGFEAAKRIKKMPACEHIPIIFITAVFTEDPYVKKGYEAGGIDYFSKPFNPEILRMKIAVYAAFKHRAEMLKERERHVRESEALLKVGQQLASVLERLPVGVLIADVEGRIYHTTREVCRIFNSRDPEDTASYGKVLGWWDTAGQMIESSGTPLHRALRNGESSYGEPTPVRCVDGSMRTILTSASPLHGLDRQIIGAVILIHDLTETKKIEEDLKYRVTCFAGLETRLIPSARPSVQPGRSV
jgi:CheY-like chemotaxis protein